MTNTLPLHLSVEFSLDKLTLYALDGTHTRGADKARLFRSILDLGVDDAAHVRDQILEGLRTGTVTGTRDSEYGVRYQVEVPVTGNNGKVAAVETVWQVEEHAGTLRFLTVRSIEKDR